MRSKIMAAISATPLVVKILLGAYVVMWLGGVGHYAIVGKPPLDAPWAATLFLALAGLVVLLTTARAQQRTLVIAALIGFAAEIIGVRYGFLFSPYSYTKVLIPHLFDVPLVMLSAWMVLVAYTLQLWGRLSLSRPLFLLICSGWMTAIDLVIDPLAANQLGYWRWVEPGVYYGIPFHNFVGWFVVSLAIFIIIPARRESSPLALQVGLSIVIFFTVIALSFKVWIAAAVGIILVLTDLLARRKAGRMNLPTATGV
ncbi:MAG: carotenoid biosynthesis protein [Acidobacteriota bacterium]